MTTGMSLPARSSSSENPRPAARCTFSVEKYPALTMAAKDRRVCSPSLAPTSVIE